ncbi:MAG TPA: acetyl-CoA hydrolase/transferase C-terminal domain-containing protein [Acidimicrobiales bacterium]|nr:acetyl-CoA hydrolase/transferase C-terminal domain-containing protein [Acidimicrobiales bacterium]
MPTVRTMEEAVALVRPVDRIGFGLGPGIPDGLLTALGSRTDWEDLQIGGALCLNLYDVFTKPGVSYRCGFFGPAERVQHAQGHRVDLVPGGFRQMGPIMARFAPRVMVAQAAPPDEGGRVNLSLHVGGTRDELLRAGRDPDRVLIVEVSPHFPRTKSLPPDYDNTIPLDVIDVLVESDGQPFALTDPPTDEVDEAIARHALAYVRDGSTLQTGIGAIPNIVAAELARGPLGGFGVHSEMFTTGLMQLHRAGKVTNDAKGIFDGVSVTTFALGVADLYRWLDGNEEVAFLPVNTVNDPTIISRNANLVSINGALSVDLYGQVMADNIDGRQISGVGGHEDFIAGAELHLDARSLICLRSTAVRDGEVVSRIAGIPREGSVVSTPRHHTGVVITEYGAAELTGSTVRERAHLLTDIAHPDFRRELRKAADGMGRVST